MVLKYLKFLTICQVLNVFDGCICFLLVLNIFTGNTRAGIIPGLSKNELELEQVSIGRDQEKYRHQGNNDLIHIYEG